MTFGEIEDDTGTGGWFTPARKSPPQSLDSAEHATEADLGAPSWFTPPRQAPEQPGPGERRQSGGAASRDAKRHGQGPDGPGRGPADGGAWREIRARGVTAANRWAEVTRGGRPAGVYPHRGPDGDGFSPGGRPDNHGFSPGGRPDGDGFSPNRRMPEDDIRAFGGEAAHAADGGSGQRGGGFGEVVPDDIPFRGARPIDVSTPRNPPARREPAYSAYSAAAASGGPGTAQRRSETGALRKIRESGAIRAIMDTGAMRTLMDTTAMQMLRERYAGKGKVIAIVGVCLWAVVAVAAIWLFAMPGG